MISRNSNEFLFLFYIVLIIKGGNIMLEIVEQIAEIVAQEDIDVEVLKDLIIKLAYKVEEYENEI